jgi:hypothetical protein
LGVKQDGVTRTLVNVNNGVITRGQPVVGNSLWLRSVWGLDGKSQYSFSLDGRTFTDFGLPCQLTWGNYRGDRIGLYSYNSKGDDGHVDADYFHYTCAGISK